MNIYLPNDNKIRLINNKYCLETHDDMIMEIPQLRNITEEIVSYTVNTGIGDEEPILNIIFTDKEISILLKCIEPGYLLYEINSWTIDELNKSMKTTYTADDVITVNSSDGIKVIVKEDLTTYSVTDGCIYIGDTVLPITFYSSGASTVPSVNVERVKTLVLSTGNTGVLIRRDIWEPRITGYTIYKSLNNNKGLEVFRKNATVPDDVNADKLMIGFTADTLTISDGLNTNEVRTKVLWDHVVALSVYTDDLINRVIFTGGDFSIENSYPFSSLSGNSKVINVPEGIDLSTVNVDIDGVHNLAVFHYKTLAGDNHTFSTALSEKFISSIHLRITISLCELVDGNITFIDSGLSTSTANEGKSMIMLHNGKDYVINSDDITVSGMKELLGVDGRTAEAIDYLI